MSETTKSYLRSDGSGKIWQIVELGGDIALKLPLEKHTGKVKWFDDSKLVRKKLEETQEKCSDLSESVNELFQYECSKSYEERNPDTIFWLDESGKYLRILSNVISGMEQRI